MGRPRGSRTSRHSERESRGEAGIIPQHIALTRSRLTNPVARFAVVGIVLGGCPHTIRAAQDAPRAAPPPLLPAVSAWETRLPALPAAPASLDDARIYVPLEDGTLVALDRATGAQVWASEGMGRSTPLVHAGTVYVPSSGGIVALDGATGRQRWAVTDLSAAAVPSAAIAGDDLLVLTDRGLSAVRAGDGRVRWARPLPAEAGSGLVIAGLDAAFVLHAAGVTALELSDGAVRWQRALPAVAGAPTVVGDRLLVGTTDKDLVALEADTGALDWRWRLGGVLVGATGRDGIVYVAALDTLLRALRLDGGNQIWKRELQTRPVAPPAIRDETVVLAGNDPVLAAFDARSGAPTGRHVEEGDLLGSPLIAPGGTTGDAGVTIVLLFRDGRVVGLKAEEKPEKTPERVPVQP